MKSFTTAISLLTIFPVPRLWTNNVKTSSTYFALTGALIGLVCFGIGRFLDFCKVSYEWQALLLVISMAAITRGFHLDGLADMADGFLGSFEKDKILRIMKDSSIGVFGALSLITVFMVKWLALKNLVQNQNYWIIISSVIVARFSMTLLSGIFEYARKEGTGNAVINNTSQKQVYISFLYVLFIEVIFWGYGTLLVILTGFLAALFIGYISQNKIDGITGDILGASSELTESLLLAITPIYLTSLPMSMWKSPVF